MSIAASRKWNRILPQGTGTPEEKNPKLSQWSSPAVPDSGWCSSNLLLGTGMVLIQRSTRKIVVVCEPTRDYWFFPRGRKDLGESLEAAALREAYEESGYRAEFMPVYNPSRAPAPPGKTSMYEQANTEPIYVTTTAWREVRNIQGPDASLGYEYLTTWYIGQIPDDAVREEGTGQLDEENYVSHLLTYEEAMKKVWGSERDVLRYAWAIFLRTLEIEDALAKEAAATEEEKDRLKDPNNYLQMDQAKYLGVYEVDTASVV